MINVLRGWHTAVTELLPLLREARVRREAARALLRITLVMLRVTLTLTWRSCLVVARLTPAGAASYLLRRRTARR